MSIESLSFDQHRILADIVALHATDGFEADMTYGNGQFWNTPLLLRPPLCFDLEPTTTGVIKADCRRLPLQSASIGSAVCDLPFLTYIKAGRSHKDGAVSMSRRFSGYYSYDELSDSYKATLYEAGRVLRKGGVLVFKCQDIVHNHKLHPTHFYSIRWAEQAGFRLLDIFILAAKNRMPSPQKGTQRHARIHHSYFLVFKKV